MGMPFFCGKKQLQETAVESRAASALLCAPREQRAAAHNKAEAQFKLIAGLQVPGSSGIIPEGIKSVIH